MKNCEILERDWALCLIDEMRRNWFAGDESIERFYTCYADGDSLDAWDAYSESAAENYDVQNETLLIFADGSCYVGWEQGINKFYPDLWSVAEQYPDEISQLGLEV